jgi:hypothetical protein
MLTGLKRYLDPEATRIEGVLNLTTDRQPDRDCRLTRD